MNTRLNQLEQALDNGKFCITAELVPPLSTDADALVAEAEPLRSLVEAVNVTDGAAAKTSMSSLAAASILASNGIEPVLQLTCRDRNRIALCADLIGAAAFGVCNLLPLTGDDPANGDQPEAKAVHDLDSASLMKLARDMEKKSALPNGREIIVPPHFFIGCADVPRHLEKGDGHPALAAKIDAGAGFVQTQLCFDLELVKAYIDGLGERGMLEKVNILIGLGPIMSGRSARWMKDNLWGVAIPDELITRLENSEDPRAEGQRICLELMQGLEELDGVSGVHLMAPGQTAGSIAEVLGLFHS